jgi:NAD(P)-dependent dehydrogenase (short-subunit alcohol dehydrogenase family)
MTSDSLFDLEGSSILVAGGAGGLGAPLAEALAQRGARLVIADLNAERTAATVERLKQQGAAAVAARLDVVDPASCSTVIDKTVETYGRIDGVLNATGVYRVADAVDLPDSDWRLTIDINLTGAFRLARAAGCVMLAQGHGRIVTIVSVSSAVANPGYAAYAASKAGVAHLTRVLAVEWAPHGVTVNAIGPSVIPTALSQPILDNETARSAALARIPAGRFGTPDDIVGAAVFLLSPASAFVTGQTLYVDGGRTCS